MKDPMIYSLEGLMKAGDGTATTKPDGMGWVPARPVGFASPFYRIRAAWLVFTGRADAVIWPGNQ